MSLAVLEWSLADDSLPPQVEAFLDASQQQVEQISQADAEGAIFSFVPSDFRLAYRALLGVREQQLATGTRFLEWGSGLGVVAGLAYYAGWRSTGIEVEKRLVEVAEELAQLHQCDVDLLCGSYVPEGSERLVEQQDDINWLRTDVPAAYDQLGLEIDDFDLIYCYPWPGEEDLVFKLFDRFAAVGGLLMTYHGQEGMELRRKVASRRR